MRYNSTWAVPIFATAAMTASFHAIAGEPFQAILESPSVVIRIPDFEQFSLGVHPNNAMQPTARLFGQGPSGVTLSVLAPTAGPTTTPQQCATWLASGVLQRFGPPLDKLQILRVGDNAYVLLFPLSAAGVDQLKAFVVSGTGKGHCIEVHVSRMNATEEQRQEWFKGFRRVSVETK